jgi:hypothetical protein
MGRGRGRRRRYAFHALLGAHGERRVHVCADRVQIDTVRVCMGTYSSRRRFAARGRDRVVRVQAEVVVSLRCGLCGVVVQEKC